MYRLLVFCGGSDIPAATLSAANGEELLAMIPKAIEEHKGCERVVVMLGATRLFSVDCEGNRLP